MVPPSSPSPPPSPPLSPSQADGTVPISFHSASYNIPILLWLLPLRLRQPHPQHDHQTPPPPRQPSGLVSVPYLHNWVYPSSNLVDLVYPPLYSQRPCPNPAPAPTPIPTPAPSQYQGARANSDATEVFWRNAIGKLVEMVHGDGEEGLFGLQAGLRQREEEVMRGVKGMFDRNFYINLFEIKKLISYS